MYPAILSSVVFKGRNKAMEQCLEVTGMLKRELYVYESLISLLVWVLIINL